MSDGPFLPGPSRETLINLNKAMPGMVHDAEQQRIFRGQRSTKMALPSKVCAICGKGFAPTMVSTGLPELSLCPRCNQNLAERQIAFVSDTRFCFVDVSKCQFGPPIELEAWRGRIVQCSVDDMDKMQLRFKALSLEKEKPADGQDIN